jgi:hypothetical protein
LTESCADSLLSKSSDEEFKRRDAERAEEN